MLKLAVAWSPDNLSLLLFDRSQDLRQISIPLGASMKEFLANSRPRRTILVIPRSEVLQKEMVLADEHGLAGDLENKIAQLLPYSPKEMAYSLAVDSSKGLLYAIPEQKINKILELLTQSGIGVDEVVSEDQALFWFYQSRAIDGPIIALDQNNDRTLFLALKENTILLSRVYPREEELKNVLSEVSFCLLESGVKPTRAFVSGTLEAEDIARTMEIAVEKLEPEIVGKTPLSAVLAGAKRWETNTAISLLPSRKKMQRQVQKKKIQLVKSAGAIGVLLLSLSFAAACHVLFLKQKLTTLETSKAKLTAEVSDVRKMTLSLESLREAELSKVRLLSLLRDLAERVPASVRLKELQLEGKSIVFQGESPSHAMLTETTQVFEKIDGIKETKLEHARLRKRQNQDFFDFEVTARW